jgi:tRNA A-37 threonylcarbamoyl transferase component Bud32
VRADALRLLRRVTRTPAAGGRLNPRYTRWCRDQGLVRPTDFLDLSGEVVSGHRDRHVVEVRIDGTKLFVKKEHRVPILLRIRNWWAGFGLVSLSEREAQTLEQLKDAGVPVPHWIAAGTDRSGRAFLLLRRVRGIELRSALGTRDSSYSRWKLAKSLGAAVARLHQAGFDAPDLSAKHVLVNRSGGVVLLDWARAKRCNTLDQSRCLSALATLHASLAPVLATDRERLAVLKSWMRALGFRGPAAPIARQIHRMAERLRRRRSIREQLYPVRDPRLLWLKGEALCIRRSYWRGMGGNIPDTLRRAALDTVLWRSEEQIEAGRLIRFPAAAKWRRAFASLLRHPLQSVGIRQAGLAFRLARHGVPVAPVLAFGGRFDGGGFLLSRISESMRPARSWLALPRPGRRSMLRRIGQLLHRCHEAGCRGVVADSLMVETVGRARLRLVTNDRLCKSTEPARRAIVADLRALTRGLGLVSRADVARVVQGYYRVRDLNANSLSVAADTLRLSGRRAA